MNKNKISKSLKPVDLADETDETKAALHFLEHLPWFTDLPQHQLENCQGFILRTELTEEIFH